MDITLTIEKIAVYDQVSLLTEYTGAKMDDPTAYERVSTIDADTELLDAFWDETKAEGAQSLRHWLTAMSEDDGTLTIELDAKSELYDETMTNPMEEKMEEYFVNALLGKWYAVANKQEAEAYAAKALSALDGVTRMIMHRKRPTPPSYD